MTALGVVLVVVAFVDTSMGGRGAAKCTSCSPFTRKFGNNINLKGTLHIVSITH